MQMRQGYKSPVSESEMQSLKEFVKHILSNKGGIKDEKTIQEITSDANMKIYEQVFTSPSVDPICNYENYEFLGDSTCNKAIIFWLYDKFPELKNPQGFKIMSRLKILYVSKKIFQHISDQKLGFLPYIRVDPELMKTQRFKVLTDVFEAFIAVTEMVFDSMFELGVGYAVVYNIIANIFKDIKISLKYEDLYDSVTRLKELAEWREFKYQIGSYNYEYHRAQDFVTCNVINKNKIIGIGTGLSQSAAQQRAAQDALKTLAHYGFKKNPPEPWLSMKL